MKSTPDFISALRNMLVVFCLCLSSHGFAQNRFAMHQGELRGYIDHNGREVIRPRFHVAGPFSGGLAAVREGGYYGYIDTLGNYVISPAYDLALPFQNGIAKVFLGNKPYYINCTGQKLFEHPYALLGAFGSDSCALVGSRSGKWGVVNRRGRLLIDTAFQRILSFEHGKAVVAGLRHNPYPRDSGISPRAEMGIIDTSGMWIVPYGRYAEIDVMQHGYAKVHHRLLGSSDSGDGNEGYINENGQYLFTLPDSNLLVDISRQGFRNGLAVVKLYQTILRHYGKPDESVQYAGLIDTTGKLVLTDTSWKAMTPFSHNRAFVRDRNADWQMIGRDGKPVNGQRYDELLFDAGYDEPEGLFQNGVALVNTEQGWQAVDTAGRLSEVAELKGLSLSELRQEGTYLILAESDRTHGKGVRYGYINRVSHTRVLPAYDDLSFDEQESGMVAATRQDRMVYLDGTGRELWQEVPAKADTPLLNIDCMNRGYGTVLSSGEAQMLAAYGGPAGGLNKPLPDVVLARCAGRFLLYIDTGRHQQWQNKYQGMSLSIVNEQADTLFFSAQDSRLYLNMQALNTRGEWQDIEYLPSSWCGNSYHTLYLAPHEHWDVILPHYSGAQVTRLRVKLLYGRTEGDAKSITVYSNEIEGTINPGQFWNLRPYTRHGIMDPYND